MIYFPRPKAMRRNNPIEGNYGVSHNSELRRFFRRIYA